MWWETETSRHILRSISEVKYIHRKFFASLESLYNLPKISYSQLYKLYLYLKPKKYQEYLEYFERYIKNLKDLTKKGINLEKLIIYEKPYHEKRLEFNKYDLNDNLLLGSYEFCWRIFNSMMSTIFICLYALSAKKFNFETVAFPEFLITLSGFAMFINTILLLKLRCTGIAGGAIDNSYINKVTDSCLSMQSILLGSYNFLSVIFEMHTSLNIAFSSIVTMINAATLVSNKFNPIYVYHRNKMRKIEKELSRIEQRHYRKIALDARDFSIDVSRMISLKEYLNELEKEYAVFKELKNVNLLASSNYLIRGYLGYTNLRAEPVKVKSQKLISKL